MPLQKKFHLVFSLVMGTFMTSFMTFVITAINVGFGPHFLAMWGRAFVIAFLVAVPVIYFVAPLARKLTGRLLGVEG
jgi:antibiotic biosynthesis monooxygenase (ABM) superfamily enzyme